LSGNWDIEGVCTIVNTDDRQGLLAFPPPGGFVEEAIPA